MSMMTILSILVALTTMATIVSTMVAIITYNFYNKFKVIDELLKSLELDIKINNNRIDVISHNIDSISLAVKGYKTSGSQDVKSIYNNIMPRSGQKL